MSNDIQKDRQTPTERKKTQRRANLPKITPKDMFSIWVEKELGIPCEKEHKFHPVRKWRFDFAIPEHKIAIEIDGGVWNYGRHNRAQGYIADMKKFNAAASLGWIVLKFTPDEQYSRATFDIIRETIKNRENERNMEAR